MSSVKFMQNPECRALLKRAMKVVRQVEANNLETLNLGWTSEEIALSAFPSLEKVRLLAPKRYSKVGLQLAAAVALDEANHALMELQRTQRDTNTYNRQALDAATETMHNRLQDYLREMGVEVLTKDDDEVYGKAITYISLNGPHTLNRMARALYNEFNLHTVFYGTNFGIVQDFLQIPPTIFGDPDPATVIFNHVAELLASSDKTAIAYVNKKPDRPAKMQTSTGAWRVLDWENLVNQKVRVNFRTSPSAASAVVTKGDLLKISGQIMQRVHSLRGYLAKFPESIRSDVNKSMRLYATTAADAPPRTDYVYVGIEAIDDAGNAAWFNLRPRDLEPASAIAMEPYLGAVLNNDTFQRKMRGYKQLKFHIVIAAAHAEAIDLSDAEVYQDLRSKIYVDTSGRNKSYPPVLVEFSKVALLNRALIMFEPVGLTLKEPSAEP